MNLFQALLYFSFFVFSVVIYNGVNWLLNQPSDITLILAGVGIIVYVWVAVTSKAFTKNPFKK
ncbi:hypothetical protein [Spirosoma terrae]|uniref:Uncharacterized protein n=1 Tax=Spirosoma terrae TaxID=1968276 RepID=A0A6L9L183_9BACT|nr:hypothetical protein [Spirosoma terrae]NDU94275.1 hypothetical protein [Spirosoma terrae]